MSLDYVSKDIAKVIAGFAGKFFPLSSTNRKFRGFFKEEREKALKKSKIMVKKNLRASFLLTFDGKFYATGNNYAGQFGIGEKIEKWERLGPVEKKVSRESPPPEERVYKENIPEWTRIGPAGKKILRVVLSATESLYVECEDGWYGTGSNAHYQLAPYCEETRLMEWRFINPPSKRKKDKIVNLIATDTAIYIQCHNGRWYARGLNKSGQLSPLFCKTYAKEWVRVGPPRKKILQLVVCSFRTFVQCKEGWYGCGKNEHGELGWEYFSLDDGWKKIDPPGKKIKQLKATELNTVIQCDDEEWYGCGYNEDGRLGTGNTYTPKDWIRLGPQGEKIKQVWLSEQRLFLRGEVELYSCGWNESRIFGGPDINETCYWRIILSSGKPIDELIDHHQALFARCGEEWYGVGWDEDGYFGLGMEEHRYEWNHLSCKGKNLRSLLPAFCHAFTCAEDGWYLAGDVAWGQSGRKDKMDIRACWTKVLSHDETVEEMLHRAKLPQPEIDPEIKKIDFRQSLKKLYQKDMLKLIEDLAQGTSGPQYKIYIFYDKARRDAMSFNFFMPMDYWEVGDDEYQFNDRLQEVLECEHISVWLNRHFQREGIADRYTSPVQISVNNYEAVVNFVKEFEDFLEQPQNILNEERGESECKRMRRQP